MNEFLSVNGMILIWKCIHYRIKKKEVKSIKICMKRVLSWYEMWNVIYLYNVFDGVNYCKILLEWYCYE